MKKIKKQTTVVVKSNDVKNNIIIFNALLKEIPFAKAVKALPIIINFLIVTANKITNE